MSMKDRCGARSRLLAASSWPFAAAAPDRVWIGDITHVSTREGWLYLATVLDVCSRRIVGWAMASQQRLDLAERALHMAIVHRRPAAGLVLHHYQGCQYTSARYRAKMEAANMILSMSRPGMPYANAMAESFSARSSWNWCQTRPLRRGKPLGSRCPTTSKSSPTACDCTRSWNINRPLDTKIGSIAEGMCLRRTVRENRVAPTCPFFGRRGSKITAPPAPYRVGCRA